MLKKLTLLLALILVSTSFAATNGENKSDIRQYNVASKLYSHSEVMASLIQVRKHYGSDPRNTGIKPLSALNAITLTGTLVKRGGSNIAVIKLPQGELVSVTLKPSIGIRYIQPNDPISVAAQKLTHTKNERMKEADLIVMDRYVEITISIEEFVKALNNGQSFRGSALKPMKTFDRRTMTQKK